MPKSTSAKTQTIYGVTSNNGDGSASIDWYRNKDLLDEFMNSSSPKWKEEYNMSDGYAAVLTFPANLDLENAGFYFQD